MFETLVPGRAKCGVLRKLKDSKRNWALNRSLIGKSREMATSVFTTPGPRSELNPALPKPTVVTGANASGSKYENELPGALTLPKIWTLGFTWLARCVASGMFSEGPDALAEKGNAVMNEAMPLRRQPPRILDPAPLAR